jgi:hypothetical protein
MGASKPMVLNRTDNINASKPMGLNRTDNFNPSTTNRPKQDK